MSGRLVSAETVREMLSWWEPEELIHIRPDVAHDYGTIHAAAPDLARTVIVQAEQIKRMETSLRIAGSMADKWAAHIDEREDDE